eukprot:UN25995
MSKDTEVDFKKEAERILKNLRTSYHNGRNNYVIGDSIKDGSLGGIQANNLWYRESAKAKWKRADRSIIGALFAFISSLFITKE